MLVVVCWWDIDVELWYDDTTVEAPDDIIIFMMLLTNTLLLSLWLLLSLPSGNLT